MALTILGGDGKTVTGFFYAGYLLILKFGPKICNLLAGDLLKIAAGKPDQVGKIAQIRAAVGPDLQGYPLR